MEKLHIDRGDGASHCGAVEGGYIHFSHFRQKMSEDVNAIDAICDVCLSKEVEKGIVISEPIDPDTDKVTIEIISFGGEPTGKGGYDGNPMSNLPADVKGYVSDIILSLGYADSTLHQIYPLLFDKKRAKGCKVAGPWGDHSKRCKVHGEGMFRQLRAVMRENKGNSNPNWHPNTKKLVAEACTREKKARKGRDMLGHPWAIWKDPPISKEGKRHNPYVPFTPVQLSDGKVTAIPLAAYGLREYAEASDELAKTLSKLRRQVAGI